MRVVAKKVNKEKDGRSISETRQKIRQFANKTEV